jgi:outer membrane lipoprotein SlyB
MKAAVIGAAVLGLVVGGCASATQAAQNPTVRGAAVGAAVGAAAGAAIGNNVGRGDAGEGALLGAAVGAVAGGVIGNRQDAAQQAQPQPSATTGPRGEPLTWDPVAKKYYYFDSRTGVATWLDGSRRQ